MRTEPTKHSLPNTITVKFRILTFESVGDTNIQSLADKKQDATLLCLDETI